MLLAYHYGFEIARFRYLYHPEVGVYAALKNRPRAGHCREDRSDADEEARKLLAGEVAARLWAREDREEIVVGPGFYPNPYNLDEHTRFSDVGRSSNPQHDVDRTLNAFAESRGAGFGRRILEAFGFAESWWNWIWRLRSESREFLLDHKQELVGLTQRALAVRPYANTAEEIEGTPSGHVTGDVLILWCEQERVPTFHASRRSVPYK
ncbi:MAG TPA: hypothetical protein VGN57_13135 [Pirellulaceae bacterium]|nr:hypothetical protein [Pirellulaceae bacterium]